MRTVVTVTIDDETPETFDNLMEAIRYWDAHTYYRACSGGIEIQEYDDDDTMMRDGWLLHVRADGTVYLNPNLR